MIFWNVHDEADDGEQSFLNQKYVPVLWSFAARVKTKQWPLAPNSPKWRITRANVSNASLILANAGECIECRMCRVRGKGLANVWRMYRVRGKWLANVWRMYRVRAKELANVWRMYRVRAK